MRCLSLLLVVAAVAVGGVEPDSLMESAQRTLQRAISSTAEHLSALSASAREWVTPNHTLAASTWPRRPSIEDALSLKFQLKLPQRLPLNSSSDVFDILRPCDSTGPPHVNVWFGVYPFITSLIEAAALSRAVNNTVFVSVSLANYTYHSAEGDFWETTHKVVHGDAGQPNLVDKVLSLVAEQCTGTPPASVTLWSMCGGSLPLTAFLRNTQLSTKVNTAVNLFPVYHVPLRHAAAAVVDLFVCAKAIDPTIAAAASNSSEDVLELSQRKSQWNAILQGLPKSEHRVEIGRCLLNITDESAIDKMLTFLASYQVTPILNVVGSIYTTNPAYLQSFFPEFNASRKETTSPQDRWLEGNEDRVYAAADGERQQRLNQQVQRFGKDPALRTITNWPYAPEEGPSRLRVIDVDVGEELGDSIAAADAVWTNRCTKPPCEAAQGFQVGKIRSNLWDPATYKYHKVKGGATFHELGPSMDNMMGNLSISHRVHAASDLLQSSAALAGTAKSLLQFVQDETPSLWP